MARTRRNNRKPKSSVALALSTGSPVARASFDRPGGTHGGGARRNNRRDRHAAKRALRHGDW